MISNYNVTNDLLIYDGAAHCPWDLNSNDKQEMIDFVTSFVYENIDCNSTELTEQNISRELIYKKDILGRDIQLKNSGIIFKIYDDGSVEKQYILNSK